MTDDVGTQVSDRLVGRVLDGRYRVGARVAKGGMATVYQALDMRLDRTVALKVMHDGLGDDAQFARRFVAEARAAARLSHPNVVAVFDQGDDDGDPVPGDGVRARPHAAGRDPRAGTAAPPPARWTCSPRSCPRSRPPTTPASSTATSSPRTC